MLVLVGDALLVLAVLYVAAGLAVGVRFASVVAAGFNGRASVGSFPFRLLLIPGAALLWPLVLKIGSGGVAARPVQCLSLPPDSTGAGKSRILSRITTGGQEGEAQSE